MRLPTFARLAGPVMVVSVVLLLVGISGAWYVHRLQTRTSEILDLNVTSIRAAEELELQIREVRTEVNRFLLTTDPTHLDRALLLRSDVEKWLDAATRVATTEQEQRLVFELDRDISQFFQQLESLTRKEGTAIEAADVTTAREILTDDILANSRQYLDLNEQELEKSSQENQIMTGRVALALLLLGTCGAIAGLVAGYGMARGLRQSIFQLSLPLRDVAGKLDDIVGPISVSADLGLEDLETILQKVSDKVSTVIEQLHRSHREVMRADQLAATGQLAAGLAHELRNPLMSMKVLVQSARRGDRANRLTERDLQVLDEEITRLETLLQTFLDFARPAQLEKRPIELRAIINQTVSLLARRAQHQGVQIQTNFDAVSYTVEADPMQIRQLLLNLLLNALDAVSRNGTIWIELQHVVDADSNGSERGALRTELRVADNGKGLPPGDRERIFEPFFSTKETGLGLGLPICRRILESHGGEIVASDRDGGGTVFTVRLPRLTADDLAVSTTTQAGHTE